jgi:hypothetical protein
MTHQIHPRSKHQHPGLQHVAIATLALLPLGAWGCNPHAGSGAALTADVGGAPTAPEVPAPHPSWRPAPMPAAPELPPEHAATTSHDFDSPRFAGSAQCGFCHDEIQDGAGTDVSIRKDWADTMMANSTRDPLWQAKVESELSRFPTLTDEIGDTCSRCHAPMANVEAKAAGVAPSILGEGGFLDSGHTQFEAAMDGVSCTACHQIEANSTFGTPEGFSGQYEIGEERRIYGPYEDPFANPMRARVGYTPTHAPHIQQSELCGSCHDLRTPTFDPAAGELTENLFPEQMIYSEWKHSGFSGEDGTSCQGCHMTPAEDVAISVRPPWLEPRPTFRRHDLVGANVFMLSLMQDHRELLGITDSLATGAAQARRFLQTAATLEIDTAEVEAGQLRFAVEVTNESGHKLPGGFPSRRAWLHVRVLDSADHVVFESGAPQPGGAIAHADADFDLDTFEPHHARVTDAAQVVVYEGVMATVDDEPTYALLTAHHWKKDNRLLPAGFDPATAPGDVAVRGAAAQDADFQAGGDRVEFEVPVGERAPYSVEVRLLYQTASYPFARDLFLSAQGPAGQRMRWLWDRAESHYEVIAQARTSTE